MCHVEVNIPKCHWINCQILTKHDKSLSVKNRNDKIYLHMSEIFKGVLNCGQMRTVIEMSKLKGFPHLFTFFGSEPWEWDG